MRQADATCNPDGIATLRLTFHPKEIKTSWGKQDKPFNHLIIQSFNHSTIQPFNNPLTN